MKIPAYKIQGFLANPDSNVKIFLFYGPEFGMVSEYGGGLVKKLTPVNDDPFAVHPLTQEALQSGDQHLGDLFSEISLFGGKKVIYIRHATDRLTPYLKEAVKGLLEHACVIEAGDLPARSSLRKFCETSPLAVSLPCYAEDHHTLKRLIASILSAASFQIMPDALEYAALHLASNRAMLRSELEKLMLFKARGDTQITLQDVEASLSTHREFGIDAPFLEALQGRSDEALNQMRALYASGETSIAIIRAALRYTHRLLLCRSALDQKNPLEEALRILKPPLFFKQKPIFIRHLQLYPTAYLLQMQKALLELEVNCKKTGFVDQDLTAALFLKFSIYNQRFLR